MQMRRYVALSTFTRRLYHHSFVLFKDVLGPKYLDVCKRMRHKEQEHSGHLLLPQFRLHISSDHVVNAAAASLLDDLVFTPRWRGGGDDRGSYFTSKRY